MRRSRRWRASCSRRATRILYRLSSARHQPRVAAGRHAEMHLEVPIQMALVDEAAGAGDFGQRRTTRDEVARGGDAARNQIAVRRCAEAAPESSGQAEAIEIGDAFEISGVDRPCELGIEEVADLAQRIMWFRW